MPPQILKINAVPAYLLEKFKFQVTRQTVYSWCRNGVGDESLMYKTRKGSKPPFLLTMYTTTKWVDEFIGRIRKDVIL